MTIHSSLQLHERSGAGSLLSPTSALPRARSHHDNPAYRLVDAMLRSALRHVPDAWSLRAENLALRWGYAYQPDARVVRLRSGLPMLVNPRDHLQMLIYYMGTFEEHCLRWMHALLPEGAVMVDVGANVGLYTLEAARQIGPEGRVIAIEAAPSHVEELEDNVERCQLGNVELVPLAVGDRRGQVKLALPPGGNLGMFTIGDVPGVSGVEVPMRPLDDVLDDLGVATIDFIKMDIEGAELAALRGGERSIDACHPAILLELNDTALRRCGSDPDQVCAWLHAHGYQGWTVTRKGLTALGSHEPGCCKECLFIHRDRRDQLERVFHRGHGLGHAQANAAT